MSVKEVDSTVASTVKTTTLFFGNDSKPEKVVEVLNETMYNTMNKQVDFNKTFHTVDEFLFDNLPIWVGVSIISFLVYLVLTGCVCFGKLIILSILSILSWLFDDLPTNETKQIKEMATIERKYCQSE